MIFAPIERCSFLFICWFYDHSIQTFIVINLPISMQKLLIVYEQKICPPPSCSKKSCPPPPHPPRPRAQLRQIPPGKEPRHASGIDARPTPKVKAAPAALCVSNRQRTRLLRDIPTYRYRLFLNPFKCTLNHQNRFKPLKSLQIIILNHFKSF